MGLVTLALGLVYAGIVAERARVAVVSEHVAARYGITAVALIVAATVIEFSGLDTVMVLSAEAVLLMWSSKRWNQPLAETGAPRRSSSSPQRCGEEERS